MYDLIVVGGGLTGVAAAVAAKREGVEKVLLIEQSGFLGGAPGMNYVNPFMPYQLVVGEDKTKDREWLSKGMFKEVLTRLREKNGVPYDHWSPVFNEEILKIIMDELTDEYGVEVLFHAKLVDVACVDGKVNSVTVAGKSGQLTLEAKYFVDATGDADLSAFAGFPFHLGREDGLCQPMTLCFRIGNIDTEAFSGEERQRAQALYKEYQAAGKITNPRENILIFKHALPGVLHFNTTRVVKHNPTDMWDVSKAEKIARKQMYEMYNFLKDNICGFENSVLLSSAPAIGVRESRMIDGEYTLTVEDLTSFTKFEDGIAACNYDIDIHSPDGSGTSHWYFPDGTYYTIPYRCLIPKNSKNLLTAGRCISSTHEAQASYRIMPVCCTLGEAAGVAIGLAVKNSANVKDVDTTTLRAKLKEYDAFF